MSSIQGIDHSNVAAERILPKIAGATGKAHRPGAEITPEPPEDTVSSASGAGDGFGPGVPRANPPEAADNLLARIPGQQDQKLKSERGEQLHTPPEAPGQLAVVLLSTISQTDSSSGGPATGRHKLDVMA